MESCIFLILIKKNRKGVSLKKKKKKGKGRKKNSPQDMNTQQTLKTIMLKNKSGMCIHIPQHTDLFHSSVMHT